MGDTHTNTIENAFSLFKRGVRGTWHHVSAKHLAAYLEEMSSDSIVERTLICSWTPCVIWLPLPHYI